MRGLQRERLLHRLPWRVVEVAVRGWLYTQARARLLRGRGAVCILWPVPVHECAWTTRSGLGSKRLGMWVVATALVDYAFCSKDTVVLWRLQRGAGGAGELVDRSENNLACVGGKEKGAVGFPVALMVRGQCGPRSHSSVRP